MKAFSITLFIISSFCFGLSTGLYLDDLAHKTPVESQKKVETNPPSSRIQSIEKDLKGEHAWAGHVNDLLSTLQQEILELNLKINQLEQGEGDEPGVFEGKKEGEVL